MDRQTNSFDSFAGLDITAIEEGLSMVTSGSGEPPKTKEKVKEKEKDTDIPEPKITIPGLMGMKIQIPETEEEAKELGLVSSEKTDQSEEKEVSEKDIPSGGEDALITETSPLYLHAATLHEEGILPTLDLAAFKGKSHTEAIQMIIEAQKKYIDDQSYSKFNALSIRQKEFLELVDKGIPQEDIEHQFRIEDAYGKITDDVLLKDPELQEQVIINDLKLKGLSDAKVQVFLKAAKDDERLFEEAKDSTKNINDYIANQKKVQIAKADEAEREASKKETELQANIKTTIDSLTEILPGIKVSAAEKTKLYNYMTRPSGNIVVDGREIPVSNINKIRTEDPIVFDLRLNYFIEQGLFKKDFDLSKLSKKMTSTTAARFAESLKGGIASPGTEGISIAKKANGIPDKIIFPKF